LTPRSKATCNPPPASVKCLLNQFSICAGASQPWADCSGYCDYPAEPVYYNYGSNVVYEGDSVYVNGDAVATPQQYAEQAVTIASTGKEAPATKEEEWLALGVFAMVQGEVEQPEAAK
jgi:hypothetical protein